MNKYRIYGHYRQCFCMDVTADDAEQAKKVAEFVVKAGESFYEDMRDTDDSERKDCSAEFAKGTDMENYGLDEFPIDVTLTQCDIKLKA